MNTYLLATNILDSEIDNFDNNSIEYIRSMGWGLEKYKNINKLKGKICPAKQDYLNLQSIIDSIVSIGITDILEIMESNTISDFTCNYVAGQIHKLY